MKHPLVALCALTLAAADFESAYRAGLQALNNNDLPAAQTQLEAAVKLQPKNPTAWLALAQAYLKQGKSKPADAAAANAEQMGHGEPIVLHGLAYYYTEARNPAMAASFEARYADKRPDDPEAAVRAADLYLRAQLPKPAAALLRKALAKQDSPELRALLAKTLDADKQFDAAVIEYRKVVQARPYDEGPYFELADSYLRRQKFAEALDALKPAREKFDKSAQIELATGVALYGLRRFPETIDSFLRTIQLDPDVNQPYIFLGRMIEVAEAKLPDVAGALATFAASKPDNYLSSFLYAKALAAQLADPDQYVPLLRKSIGLNAKFWESRLELGAALERKKEFPAAAAELVEATKLNPAEPTAHYRLARVYDRLGEKEKAAAERALHAKLSAQEKPSGMTRKAP